MRNTTLRGSMALVATILSTGLAMQGACTSSSSGPAGASAVDSFPSAADGLRRLAGEWEVVELGGNPVSALLPPDYDERKPSMTIKPDGGVNGFSGVNQYGSQLDSEALTRGRFSLGPIAMTRMAGPPEFMSLESRLTLALSEPRRFSLKGDLLTLMPGEGRADPLARFRRGSVGAAAQDH